MQPFDVDPPEDDWGIDPEALEEEEPMYEPDAPAQSDQATQWAPYDNTAAIPHAEDYPDFGPVGVSEPPDGRQYAMYRQPPTWQHASLAGAEGGGPQVNLGGILQGFGAIAVASALGYGLTGSGKVALGSGVGMAGALQLPSIVQGQFMRAMVGAAMLGGAYFILREDLEGLEAIGARPNFDDGYDEDDDDFEENDHDDDDDDEDEEEEDDDDAGGGWSMGAKSAKDEPARSSPWLKSEAI